MKLGFVLPNVGSFAGPEAIVAAARRAEALGYDSVWTGERVLFPLAPRTPYPATPDGVLPEGFRRNLDPLAALTLAAAHTERVRLGTSVLAIPYYNPVMLARNLATVDILSGGRLDVGLGLGWSVDELEATGAPHGDRGRRADEFIRVLKAVWGADPVEFAGEFHRVAPSIVAAKPIQQPHPPLLFAAYTPGAMRRAATMGNGWNPTGFPAPVMAQIVAGMRAMAAEAGRDPAAFALTVRANVYLLDRPYAGAGDRPIFVGAAEEIAADIADVRAIGATELFFDLTFSPGIETLDRLLDEMAHFRALAAEPALAR